MSAKKWVYASDVHSVYQEPGANKALFEFIKSFKPHYRILGGDLWNFDCLRKGASEDERRLSLLDDYQSGLDWAKEFEPTQFLLGNHEYRMWDLALKNDGVKSDFAKQTIKEIEKEFKKFHCPIFPYNIWDGVFALGKLNFVHGFWEGKSAAQHHVEAFDNCVFGHVHTFQVYSQPNKSQRMGWASGCLCQLNLPYLYKSKSALAHANGWTYGITYDNGDFEVYQAKEVNGKFQVAKDFIEL